MLRCRELISGWHSIRRLTRLWPSASPELNPSSSSANYFQHCSRSRFQFFSRPVCALDKQRGSSEAIVHDVESAGAIRLQIRKTMDAGTTSVDGGLELQPAA